MCAKFPPSLTIVVLSMDKDDDLDAAFICVMISATTLLNFYDEQSECCTKHTLRLWIDLRILSADCGTPFRSRRLFMRPLSILLSYDFRRFTLSHGRHGKINSL